MLRQLSPRFGISSPLSSFVTVSHVLPGIPLPPLLYRTRNQTVALLSTITSITPSVPSSGGKKKKGTVSPKIPKEKKVIVKPLPSIREITTAELRQFKRDGYVFVRKMFTPEEMGILRTTVENDQMIDNKMMDMKDASGRVSKLTLWSNVPYHTTYGAIAAGRRMVHAANKLMGNPVYHFHTKIMLKGPRTGGAWNVHQDFGYWYRLGCLDPHVMMSSILAIDEATLENGCLQVVKGSHALGRLDHGTAGEQAGADPKFVKMAQERYPTVVCSMEPGDVLFTHSNLLHWSEPNLSEKWRRAMIIAYNGVNNPPFADNGISPLPNPLLVQDDSEIQKLGPVGHTNDPAKIAALEFLETEKNVKTFKKGPEFTYTTATA